MKNKKPSEMYLIKDGYIKLPEKTRINNYYEVWLGCFNCGFSRGGEVWGFLIKKGNQVKDMKCPVCKCKTLIMR